MAFLIWRLGDTPACFASMSLEPLEKLSNFVLNLTILGGRGSEAVGWDGVRHVTEVRKNILTAWAEDGELASEFAPYRGRVSRVMRGWHTNRAVLSPSWFNKNNQIITYLKHSSLSGQVYWWWISNLIVYVVENFLILWLLISEDKLGLQNWQLYLLSPSNSPLNFLNLIL